MIKPTTRWWGNLTAMMLVIMQHVLYMAGRA